MTSVTPFLWFDHEAEQAAEHYVALVPNSRILDVTRYPDGAPGEPGAVMTVRFSIDGLVVSALNGGPAFSFTEAVSFAVSVDTQEEIDRLWFGLSDGGEPGRCGWLKDRYGLSWQIVPPQLGALLGDPDPERSARVMQAMLGMGKIDIAALEAAAEG